MDDSRWNELAEMLAVFLPGAEVRAVDWDRAAGLLTILFGGGCELRLSNEGVLFVVAEGERGAGAQGA